jgi:hypothetical protein
VSAASAADRAPDLVGEVIAFRAWRVPRRGAPRLQSMNGVPWPCGRWMLAECECCEEIPGENCSCGIYAGRHREHLVELGYNRRSYYDGESVAIGEVGLAGKVIVGTQGWRAEKARPIRLWLPYADWRLAQPLSRAYRAPVQLSNTLRGDA